MLRLRAAFPQGGAGGVYVFDDPESILEDYFKQLADTPWGFDAALMWRKRNCKGLYIAYVQAATLTYMRDGDLAAFEHLLQSPFVPENFVAAYFATMLPPHTAESPFYKIDLVPRLGASCQLGRAFNNPIAGRVIFGFEGNNTEPFREMVTKGQWPRDVSKYVLEALASHGETAYQFKVFSHKRGRRWPAHIELRDILIADRYKQMRSANVKGEAAKQILAELTDLDHERIRQIIRLKRRNFSQN
jgi:hypothetical protein